MAARDVARLAPMPKVSAEAPSSNAERTADFFVIGSIVVPQPFRATFGRE